MSHRSLRPRPSFRGPIATGIMGAALGLAMAAAQTTVPEEGASPLGGDGGDESGGLFSGGLLPNGSVLKNVVLPSYDEKLNMVSSVKAGNLTIFTRDEQKMDLRTNNPKTVAVLDKVEVKDLRISFFNPDRSSKGNIAMTEALLEVRKKLTLLSSDEPVSFVSDDLKVDGSALAFDTRNNRGFLHGPVTAVAKNIEKDKSTSMKATPTRGALAAGAMMMAAAPALPAQQKAVPADEASVTTAERFNGSLLSQEQLAEVAAQTASRASEQVEQIDAAGKNLADIKATSNDARLTMNNFLQAASLVSLLADAAPAAGAAPADAPDVPRPAALADTKDTVVKAKKGAYFDSKEGLLIFLGDVTVTNPQLQLKGASEVKLFLEPDEGKKEETAPKPKDGAANGKPKPPPTQAELEAMLAAKHAKMAEDLKKAGGADKGSEGGTFGDAKRMVATGPAVHIRFDSGKPGDKPVEASAHSIIYDFEKEQILLQGGSPWVFQEGGMQGQAKGAKAYILIHTDGDGNLTKVVTHNPDGFEANVKTPPKKEAPKPKPQQQPKR
ncbi:hypothetical protein OKA04_21635 [Luteolibacter flavescens]|uniref:Organic solvent tolerance-like N-terminal domain-containing protein n=1 Tax=Luteolibacter flavescens TaxID=1859460 RepID=A0ABT3FVK6_9BACT|nr:hypothetical protein [Luteolibacter flavescens]MCW1887354.1 hypothetical protein [Luteolibacter flavescens]